ncbi:hypothetical protein JNW90_29690, partial [Micromonospora sp. STR1s_5]|nr:hypothetical protein [Micromonospora sp. STR1s_5]
MAAPRPGDRWAVRKEQLFPSKPATPAQHNSYDRRICAGLGERGWSVHEHQVPGAWPHPDLA